MEFLPNKNDNYGSKNYWINRFEKEKSYDWLVNYDKVKHLLTNYVKKDDFILIVGCGNSSLGHDMFNDGYKLIHSMDYCENVVHQMATLNCDSKKIFWSICDVQKLPFKDSSFDVVIDKATLDTLFVGEKSLWNLSLSVKHTFHQVINEINRILTRNGVFLSISFNEPILRGPLLNDDKVLWGIEKVEKIGTNFNYFMYVVRKNILLDDRVKIYDYHSAITIKLIENCGVIDELSENDIFSIDL